LNGLVLAGTNAEAVLLSAEERKELVKIARKAALDLGRPNFPIVAGISGQSTNETIRLAEDALSAGADFGLLLPPNYWAKAVTKDALLGFYRDVADETTLPIVIYSVSIFSLHRVKKIKLKLSSSQLCAMAST
jgi:2-keto-3-deoxy-L-rhamnonate aldolase